MADTDREESGGVSGWAATGVAFAACLLLVIGVFQVIAGLAAIVDDDFFVVARGYAFEVDTSAWGFIHIVIGAVLVLTSLGLFTGAGWAVVLAIIVACLSAIANFFFIPYYPFWAILVIALDIWVVWSLTRPGVVRR